MERQQHGKEALPTRGEENTVQEVMSGDLLSFLMLVHHVAGMTFLWSCSIGTLDSVERLHVLRMH